MDNTMHLAYLDYWHIPLHVCQQFRSKHVPCTQLDMSLIQFGRWWPLTLSNWMNSSYQYCLQRMPIRKKQHIRQLTARRYGISALWMATGLRRLKTGNQLCAFCFSSEPTKEMIIVVPRPLLHCTIRFMMVVIRDYPSLSRAILFCKR